MTSKMTSAATALAALLLGAACAERTDVQCEADEQCNLGLDGMCTMNTTGNRWCTHADATCPSARRWSDLDVGDGVSGQCVGDDPMADAGPDGVDAAAGTADAGTADAGTADAMPPSGPNCVGLAETCGPLGTDDCCASEEVPGGTYYRSYDMAVDDHNDMGYPATVSTFRLDTYEASVGRFRTFVEAGMGTEVSPPAVGASARMLNEMANQGGWDNSWNPNLAADTTALIAAINCDPLYQTWTDDPAANEMKPMNCLTWYEAFAFCAWDGGFLPTEAEWNYAATGGSEQRAYPWSVPASDTTIDCSYANYRIDQPPGTYCENGNTGGFAAVGSRSPTGNGRWGHADLVGNTWEWVLDWYAAYSPTCINCASLDVASQRARRGGAFNNYPLNMRTGFRIGDVPSSRIPSRGVRCARLP